MQVQVWPITDLEDASFFREHAMLGAQSGHLTTPDGLRVKKLAVKGYTDDVESCNSIGFAAGKHKLCCIYGSLVNLPPELRNLLKYTFVVSVCCSSVVKRYGMGQVFGGVDKNKKPMLGHETSFGGQLRALDKGFQIGIPNRIVGHNTFEMTYFKGWLVHMAFDYPAGGSLLPFAESVAAKKPCRQCNWNRLLPNAFSPASFLPGAPTACQLWDLRTDSEVTCHMRFRDAI